MDNESQMILQEVLKKTNSELIIFFVIVAVVLVIFFIPLYNMIRKDRKDRVAQENVRQDKYIEREKQIIGVITANTDVIAGLKVTLEQTNITTNTSLGRIQDKIDQQYTMSAERGITMSRIQTTLDEIVRKQQSTSEDIKRVLLIVGSMPNTSNFSTQGREVSQLIKTNHELVAALKYLRPAVFWRRAVP